MITNLLATLTITLTTNTVEHFPQHVVSVTPAFGSGGFNYTIHTEDDPNPTQKDVVTEIHKATHLQFNYDGAPYGFNRDDIIWASTNHFQMDSQWKPSTNSLPPPRPLVGPYLVPCAINVQSIQP